MEGTVYDLGAGGGFQEAAEASDASETGRIGKIWYRRRPKDLALLQQFYAELETGPSPILFPRILEIGELDGHAVTVERKLTGTTLGERLRAGTATVEQGWECVLEVLAVLREIPAGSAAKALPVLDEPQALWPGADDGTGPDTWSRTLHALVERRAELFGPQLRAAVTDFDGKLARVLAAVRRLPEPPLRAIHGDLVPENILVDAACRPRALLDWGFLSTAGDPAFDAALAAGLFDMYGEGARESEAELLARIQDRAGYPRELMHLYRAVYAIVTSCVYDLRGQDGHFAWCAASLERDDVVAALG
jgi:hypothetical protein